MNLLRKTALMVVRRLGLVDVEAWRGVGMGESHAGETVSESRAMALSAVWGCVNLYAGIHGTLPAFVYRTGRNDQREIDQAHPLYRVIHNSPNAEQTASDFWEAMAMSLELRGNAYARITRSGDRIVALTPIYADVLPRRLANGDIEYAWSEESRTWRLTQRDVFHIRGPGGHPLGGMSTLAFARHTFGLALAVEKAAGKMFANGLRPSGVLAVKEWLSKENRQIARGELVDQFVGAENAGRPLILEGGTEWKPLSIPPEDAQMLESRSFSVEEICRFFGVPPFLVGHNEKSSGYPKSLEQQLLLFKTTALHRRINRIEQAIEQQLLSPADRGAGVTVEFSMEAFLRGDSTSRAAYYQRMSGIGAMTINEIRRLENMPPVTGGDVPRMQMQNIPIDSPLAADEQGQREEVA